MMGNREVDLNDYVKNLPAQQEPVYNEDGTTSYGYAAHITLGDIHKFQRGSSLWNIVLNGGNVKTDGIVSVSLLLCLMMKMFCIWWKTFN